MLLVKLAVLHELKLSLNVFPILAGCVVPAVTLGTLKGNFLNRPFLLTSLNTTPNRYKANLISSFNSPQDEKYLLFQ